MKTLILDGSLPGDDTGFHIGELVIKELTSRQVEVEVMKLHEKTIHTCRGLFFCWTRNPGICDIDDDNRLVAEAMANCDHLVILSPIRFGSYSPLVKTMLDHFIQNTSPYFMKIHGETHHRKRYPQYPDLTVIGWLPEENQREESVFRCLVGRNGINFHSKRTQCLICHENESQDDWEGYIKKLAPEYTDFELNDEKLDLSGGSIPSVTDANIRKAALLVGSPRGGKSTSYRLGEYYMGRLSERNIETEVFHIHRISRKTPEWGKMLESLSQKDFVFWSFPLYIDTFPAKMMAFMEEWADVLKKTETKPKLAAMVNCGFPEKIHCVNVLESCSLFAEKMELPFLGGLILPGGRGIGKKPIQKEDSNTKIICKGLDLAAEETWKGKAFSIQTKNILSKPTMPSFLYRLGGNLMWKTLAKKHGQENSINRMPYQIEDI